MCSSPGDGNGYNRKIGAGNITYSLELMMDLWLEKGLRGRRCG